MTQAHALHVTHSHQIVNACIPECVCLRQRGKGERESKEGGIEGTLGLPTCVQVGLGAALQTKKRAAQTSTHWTHA